MRDEDINGADMAVLTVRSFDEGLVTTFHRNSYYGEVCQGRQVLDNRSNSEQCNERIHSPCDIRTSCETQ